MSQVIGVDTVKLPIDAYGRLRLDALEEELRTGRIGTVVLTPGTTPLGAVDPIADAVDLCRRYGCRIHVDAAYGGFYALLAWADDAPGLLSDASIRLSCSLVVASSRARGAPVVTSMRVPAAKAPAARATTPIQPPRSSSFPSTRGSLP